ncbi:uncharacterized protein BO97DRAFT_439440 [Aspergillus homomorphus CBS 101889]|uniref:Uncharacterized protein n=1 Tax=Aspergillus homomorphus (strain CBS 101889) TaxID=1450537 RepID=A0A395IBF1_ASPHC|nr:hypothetical protein BO97DRAFT_439440 [Aspergillus homomorphus CBS 101889]RAL17560.1 hypothetical protein BO97DRAFT_439440 [Aspergillus homomorphus CBS 101889]
MLLRRLTPSTLSKAGGPARPLRTQCLNLTHNPKTNRQQQHQQQTLNLTRQFTTTTTRPSPSPFRLTSTPNPNTNDAESHAETDPHAEINTRYSLYKPKRQWPPDMSKLSPKHQFRLERKYRRRAALKYARPKWSKATKLVQWFSIGFVLIYAMLFMEWDERGSPFDEIRKAVFGGVKGAFSTPAPPRPVREAGEEKGRE